MALNLGTLWVQFGAKLDGMERGLKSGLQKVDNFEKDVQRKLDNLTNSFDRAGKQWSLKVTAPVVALGALTLRSAGLFEEGMNRVRALTGATGDDFGKLRNQAKDLGATTMFTAGQVADGMGFLAMAGFDVNETLGAMPSVLQLATAAQLDLGRAADITSNILTGYGLEVHELAGANDILVKAMTSANVDLEMLGTSFKFVGPLAKAAGVTFDETAAAIALMGDAGIQGSMAGTSLRRAITSLIAPTAGAQRVLDRLGVTTTDAQGRMLPLADILQQLEEGGARAADMMELFGDRAGPAMQSLLDRGSDALRDFSGELRMAGGTAERIAAVQMEGLRGAGREVASAFEGLQISIADSGLIDWATRGAKAIALFLRNLSNLNPEILRLGTVIAIAAATIGPLLLGMAVGFRVLSMVVGMFGAAVAFVTSPIFLLIAGLTLLLTAWESDWLGIKTFTESTIVPFIERTLQGMVDKLDAITSGARAVRDALAEWRDRTVNWLVNLEPGEISHKVQEWLGGAIDWAVNLIEGTADLAGRWIQTAATWAINLVEGAATLAGDFVRTSRNWLINLLEGNSSLAGDWLVIARNWAVNLLQGASDLAGDWVRSATEWTVNLIQGAAELAGDWLRERLPWLVDLVEGVSALAGDWIRTGLEWAVDLVQGAINLAGEWVRESLPWLVDLVQGVSDLAGDWIRTARDWVINLVEGASSLAGDWVRQSRTWLINLVEGAYSLAGDWITTSRTWLVNLIEGTAILAGNWVRTATSWAVDLVQGADNAVRPWVNRAVDWFVNLVPRVEGGESSGGPGLFERLFGRTLSPEEIEEVTLEGVRLGLDEDQIKENIRLEQMPKWLRWIQETVDGMDPQTLALAIEFSVSTASFVVAMTAAALLSKLGDGLLVLGGWLAKTVIGPAALRLYPPVLLTLSVGALIYWLFEGEGENVDGILGGLGNKLAALLAGTAVLIGGLAAGAAALPVSIAATLTVGVFLIDWSFVGAKIKSLWDPLLAWMEDNAPPWMTAFTRDYVAVSLPELIINAGKIIWGTPDEVEDPREAIEDAHEGLGDVSGSADEATNSLAGFLDKLEEISGQKGLSSLLASIFRTEGGLDARVPFGMTAFEDGGRTFGKQLNRERFQSLLDETGIEEGSLEYYAAAAAVSVNHYWDTFTRDFPHATEMALADLTPGMRDAFVEHLGDGFAPPDINPDWVPLMKDFFSELLELFEDQGFESMEQFLRGIEEGSLDLTPGMIATMQLLARDGGKSAAEAWADGLRDAKGDAADAADELAQEAADRLVGESPPPEGPLSDVDEGGFNTGMAWLDGLLAVGKTAGSAVSALAGTVKDMLVGAFENLPEETKAKLQPYIDILFGAVDRLKEAQKQADRLIEFGLGRTEDALDRSASRIRTLMNGIAKAFKEGAVNSLAALGPLGEFFVGANWDAFRAGITRSFSAVRDIIMERPKFDEAQLEEMRGMLRMDPAFFQHGAPDEAAIDRVIQSISEQTIPTGIARFFERIREALQPSIDAVKQMFSNLIEPLREMWERFKETPLGEAVDEFVGGIVEILNSFIPGLGDVIGALIQESEGFAHIVEIFGAVFQWAVRLIDITIRPLLPLFQVLAETLIVLMEAFAPVIQTIADILAPVLKFIADAVKTVANVFIDVYNWIAGTFLGRILGLKKIARMGEKDDDGKLRLPPIPDPPPPPGFDDPDPGIGGGGAQFSEITGRARDVLVGLLSPLAALDQIPGFLVRQTDAILEMRDAFRDMGPMDLAVAGVAGGLTVQGPLVENLNIHGVSESDAEEFVDTVAQKLGDRYGIQLDGGGS